MWQVRKAEIPRTGPSAFASSTPQSARRVLKRRFEVFLTFRLAVPPAC